MKTRRRAPQKVYTLADEMRLTGAKRPQIEYWVRKSIIRGELEDGDTAIPRRFIFLVANAFREYERASGTK